MLRKTSSFFLHTSLKDIPLVDLNRALPLSSSSNDCFKVAESFKKFGCVIIKDDRIDQNKNKKMIDTIKQYYIKRQAMLDRGEQPQDVFKELHYEIGLSPPGIIKLDDCQEIVSQFTEENKSMTPYPPVPSKTLRYLWNLGSAKLKNRPPSDFPHFESIFNDWGNQAFNIGLTLSLMLEIGLQLPKGSFSQNLIGGENKLAPNGFDLTRCRPNEPFIGFHYDFGFLTIHGRSSFPGLFIWTSEGRKIKVRVPPGYLFIQAGNELEYLTGGCIKSGYHEAINTQEVQALAKKDLEEGGNPWRINSTIFTHIRSDVTLRPIGHFASEAALKQFPPINQEEFMMGFLRQRQTTA